MIEHMYSHTYVCQIRRLMDLIFPVCVYRWVIIPGATKITVTFEAPTRTEPEFDFVKLYKVTTYLHSHIHVI